MAIVSVLDYVNKARQEKAHSKKYYKATVNNIAQFFRDTYKLYYNTTPVFNKNTGKYLKGLLTLLKNNGIEDEDIFRWIEDIVSNWEDVKLKYVPDINGKKRILKEYPNLMDIIMCRDYFIQQFPLRGA